jgi:hypothetical protein
VAKVQQATFTPTPEGGELRATLEVGDQELTTKWPVMSQDDELNSLLDDLLVTVQQVTFVSSETGGEIRANMEVGGQVFVSRWPADSSNPELRDRFDRFLDEVRRKCVTNLQAALEREKEPA